MTTGQDKDELRSMMRARRKALVASGHHADLSSKVSSVLSQAFTSYTGAILASYIATGSEVNLTVFHQAANHLQLCLPVVRQNTRVLSFCPFDQDTVLTAGAHATQQPAKLSDAVVPQIIILPLLAFDKAGGRLGQGGGYYDATIASIRATGAMPKLIGAAFACQEVPEVPRERHDVLLDAIATQEGIRYV